MPKYLLKGSYSPEGIKGVLKEGGSGRKKAIQDVAKSVGGKVEAMYFAFGDTDAYVVVDLPDNVAAAAVGLVVSASGLANASTVVLLTPEEIDELRRRP